MTIIEYFDMIDQLNSTLNRYGFCAVTRLFLASKDNSIERRELWVKSIDAFHKELESYLLDNISHQNIEVISKSLILEEFPVFNENEKEYVAIYILPSNTQINIFLIAHITKL